jgi:hypothetical protein
MAKGVNYSHWSMCSFFSQFHNMAILSYYGAAGDGVRRHGEPHGIFICSVCLRTTCCACPKIKFYACFVTICPAFVHDIYFWIKLDFTLSMDRSSHCSVKVVTFLKLSELFLQASPEREGPGGAMESYTMIKLCFNRGRFQNSYFQ